MSRGTLRDTYLSILALFILFSPAVLVGIAIWFWLSPVTVIEKAITLVLSFFAGVFTFTVEVGLLELGTLLLKREGII